MPPQSQQQVIPPPRKRPKYIRHVHINRQVPDIQRLVLNYLQKMGPSSVTRISYMSEINSKQKDIVFGDMVLKGFIEIKPVSEFLPKKGRKGNSRIARLHPCVKNVVTITPLGLKYLEMANDLEKMIKWET